jgi:hypothetical protein
MNNMTGPPMWMIVTLYDNLLTGVISSLQSIYASVKHLACVVTHVSQWCLREAKNLKTQCMIKAIKHEEANL